MAQQIYDVATGEVTQFEVLLRMLDDHGDLIAPGAFLSTAERLGIRRHRPGLGKETTAEHVGDAATVAPLRKLGVTHGQDFHLGEPQPLERFLDELFGRPTALA